MNMERDAGKVNFPAVAQEQIGMEPIPTVNARDLHAFLESRANFADWIKQRIEQYGSVEHRDYTLASENSDARHGGYNRKDYHISLDMAKELSMVERNEKGKQERQYFIECERRAKSAPLALDLENPAQLRGLLMNYAERTQIAEAKVVEFQPRSEAFTRLEASEGSQLPRVEAKVFTIPERKFFRWLFANSWAFKQGKTWQGYSEKIKQGYLEHDTHTYSSLTAASSRARSARR